MTTVLMTTPKRLKLNTTLKEMLIKLNGSSKWVKLVADLQCTLVKIYPWNISPGHQVYPRQDSIHMMLHLLAQLRTATQTHNFK